MRWMRWAFVYDKKVKILRKILTMAVTMGKLRGSFKTEQSFVIEPSSHSTHSAGVNGTAQRNWHNQWKWFETNDRGDDDRKIPKPVQTTFSFLSIQRVSSPKLFFLVRTFLRSSWSSSINSLFHTSFYVVSLWKFRLEEWKKRQQSRTPERSG